MKAPFIIILLICLVVSRLIAFYAFPLKLTTGQHVDFQTVLYQDPKVFGNTQEFFVRIGDFWHSTDVLVSTSADTQIAFGQTLRISGHIKILPRSGGFQPRTPEGQFNVASILSGQVLSSKQVIFAIQNPQIEAENTGILPFFGALRAKIIDFCENNFSQPYSSLLISIIFGIKNNIPHQITTSFRITGLSHLLVVDGLKITLVTEFILDLFLVFFPRKGALLGSIVFIFLYIALSGFEISAVRAGVMAIVAFGAQLFGRQYLGMYVLVLLGGAMLLWDPLLLENVAFQLSLLATAGIVVLKPILPLHGGFLDDFNITLAAQIATLPILLTTFGTYSLISIPVHVLVMWAIPVIMTVGGVGIGIGLLIPLLGKLLVLSTIPLVWYLEQTASFFANYFQPIHITNFPLFLNIGYYLLLIACALFIHGQKSILSRGTTYEQKNKR